MDTKIDFVQIAGPQSPPSFSPHPSIATSTKLKMPPDARIQDLLSNFSVPPSPEAAPGSASLPSVQTPITEAAQKMKNNIDALLNFEPASKPGPVEHFAKERGDNVALTYDHTFASGLSAAIPLVAAAGCVGNLRASPKGERHVATGANDRADLGDPRDAAATNPNRQTRWEVPPLKAGVTAPGYSPRAASPFTFSSCTRSRRT